MDAVEASTSPTTDLWIWAVNPTPSYFQAYEAGLRVTKDGEPVYSMASGSGAPREYAQNEFTELKNWYQHHSDREKLESFYLPWKSESVKHR